jgi:phage RecT family recombinase
MSNQSIAQVIEVAEERFNQIAPSSMKYEAEKGFAIQLLKNSSYLMQVATAAPQSLQQAITNVAAIGLSLNPAEKMAYLIPRNIKISKDKWETRVFLEPSYIGLIRLATNSGSIDWIQANTVHESDTFTDNGMGDKPTHVFDAFANKEKRGDVVGVYAVAKTSKGDYLTATMSLDRILEIRDRSESYKKYQSGVWVTDFEEMAKKAVIRLLFKTLPRTDENSRMAMAVEISNENEGFEPIINNPDIGQYTANQKETFDKIISDGDAFGMFVFSRTIDRGVFDNLYHSFEKGTKGKYQKIIDSLNSDGAEVANEYAMSITEMANRGDVDGYRELINPLTNDDLKVIDSLLDSEVQMIVSREFAGV